MLLLSRYSWTLGENATANKKKKNNLTRDPCDIELSLACYQRLKLVQVGRWEHNRSAWKVAKPQQNYMDADIR